MNGKMSRDSVQYTLECVKKKGVDFCFNCDEFPCANLAPTADGAARYPHYMKMYNLCRIKQVGLEKWIGEAGDYRKPFLDNTMKTMLLQDLRYQNAQIND